MFKVFCKAPVSAEPCKDPFDDPAARQKFEAICLVRSFYDFDGPLPHFGECGFELAALIAAVSEDMAQPGETLADAGKQVRCAVAILDVSSVDQDMDQIAVSISNDMPLSAFGLLARIIAAWPTGLRSFDALAVDHTRAG